MLPLAIDSFTSTVEGPLLSVGAIWGIVAALVIASFASAALIWFIRHCRAKRLLRSADNSALTQAHAPVDIEMGTARVVPHVIVVPSATRASESESTTEIDVPYVPPYHGPGNHRPPTYTPALAAAPPFPESRSGVT